MYIYVYAYIYIIYIYTSPLMANKWVQCSNYSIATHKRFRKVVDQHSLLLCTAIALLLSVRWPTAMRMEMSELLQWIYIYICYVYLVGGFNPSEKYKSQLGWLFPIYGKINMFQTTNQIWICIYVMYMWCLEIPGILWFSGLFQKLANK